VRDYNKWSNERDVAEKTMTNKKHSSRKTSRKVRMPATRFGHLQKRMRERKKK